MDLLPRNILVTAAIGASNELGVMKDESISHGGVTRRNQRVGAYRNFPKNGEKFMRETMKQEMVSARTRGPFSRRQALAFIGTGIGAVTMGPLLAACSSPTASTTSQPTKAATAANGSTSVPKAARSAGAKTVVTLQFDNLWDAKNNTHYKGMQYLYKQFNAKHPDIKIKEVIIPTGQLSQKEKADCAAGSCPDIMHDLDGTFWSSGYLLDLTSYLNDDPTWKNEFQPSPLAFNSTSGHYWGLPSEVGPQIVVWNTKILDSAGVSSIPTTWNDLVTVCDKIKKAGKTPTSWALGGILMWDDILASQTGGLKALQDNKFDAPPIQETFKLMKTFVDNKWVPANDIEITSDQAVANFLGGQVAFYMDGPWTIQNNILSAGAPPDLKNHVKFSAFPGTSTSGTVAEIKVATTNGLAKTLAKDESKLNAALTFMKFWFSPEIAKEWIPLTWSPMGIKVSLKDVKGLPPLPTQLLSVQEDAKMPYTLPATKAMQDHQWDQATTALQTLEMGKSVGEALKTYTQFMAKYTQS